MFDFAIIERTSFLDLNLPATLKIFPELRKFIQSGGPVSLAGLDEAQKVYVCSILADVWQTSKSKEIGRLIFVHGDHKKLQAFREDVRQNAELPLDDSYLDSINLWGLQRYTDHSLQFHERIKFLHELKHDKRRIFFATLSGLSQKSINPEDFLSSLLILDRNQEYDTGKILEDLRARGYREVDRVDGFGQFAVKGGIVDIFSSGDGVGTRCEFMFDNLVSLRTFDPNTNLTISEVERAYFPPCSEIYFRADSRAQDAQRLFDVLSSQGFLGAEFQRIVDRFMSGDLPAELNFFFPEFLRGKSSGTYKFLSKDDTVVFLDSVESLDLQYKKQIENLHYEWVEDRRESKFGLDPEDYFEPSDIIKEAILNNPRSISFIPASLIEHFEKENILHNFPIDISERKDKSGSRSIDFWVKYLRESIASEVVTIILYSQSEHLHRIQSVLSIQEVPFRKQDGRVLGLLKVIPDKGIHLVEGSLSHTIYDSTNKIFLIPEHVLFDENYRFRRNNRSTKSRFDFKKFNELTSGSLVVHADHGVGCYQGLKGMEIGGIRTDFLQIEYAEKDRLYLPVHKLFLLQKFSALEAGQEGVSLDKLRGGGWTKRKQKTAAAVEHLAQELLRVYAERKASKRNPYAGLSEEYYRFEADFQHSETADQQRAIDEVNMDLSRDFPMDRLVCGDVGFGKTEVALRASMRVVLSGFQVIVLAPTSLLSFQHYNTFHSRCRKYGVEVRLINRFEKAKDIKESLEEFSQGKVDILIGTHRILTDKIGTKKLGLLVIDEEQRFGVTHKEQIRKLKAKCDVLALSATPIPRSLQLSLLGIRDISIIATPPFERLPIKTYVAEYSEGIVKKALEFEASRGGQSFVVHNKISDLEKVFLEVSRLVPHLRLVTIHGQLKDGEIEEKIVDFIERKYDVLICTSIIESGIDIPNVNTIIVNRADFFGLSQLYQMRGRVGRSTRQSYAFFLTSHILHEESEAKRRLNILAQHQMLGVGFQIASYDLDLRGGGNILGGEQSGHVDSIGYDMFMDMVQKEVDKINGVSDVRDIEPEIRVDVDATLPESYIPREGDRLSLYKTLFSSKNLDEIFVVRAEIEDQFGQMPDSALCVLLLAKLRVALKNIHASLLQAIGQSVFEVRFQGLTEAVVKRISDRVLEKSEIFEITEDFRLLVNVNRHTNKRQNLELLVDSLLLI